MKNVLLTILLFTIGLGCEHLAVDPVPFADLTKDHPNIPPFFAWKNESPDNPNSFQAFLVSGNAIWNKVLGFHENPREPFKEMGKNLFSPESVIGVNALNESLEIASPDGKWVVKTYSIKTYADDLDNAYLVVRRANSGNYKKLKVRAQSNGEMRPLFWHPQKPLFYFELTIGVENQHSYELWEYNAIDDSFKNIGDTNGHIFLSPDGGWILWETGLFLDSKQMNPPLHSGILCIYNIDKKINYQLVSGPSLTAFQRWKNP